MTREQLDKYSKAAVEGTIPDEENPIYLFSTTSTKLLVLALNKEFSLTELARMQLASRGLNVKGEWVGFGPASEKLKKHMDAPKKNSRTPKGKRP